MEWFRYIILCEAALYPAISYVKRRYVTDITHGIAPVDVELGKEALPALSR
jgi:hypothetical protein